MIDVSLIGFEYVSFPRTYEQKYKRSEIFTLKAVKIEISENIMGRYHFKTKSNSAKKSDFIAVYLENEYSHIFISFALFSECLFSLY